MMMMFVYINDENDDDRDYVNDDDQKSDDDDDNGRHDNNDDDSVKHYWPWSANRSAIARVRPLLYPQISGAMMIALPDSSDPTLYNSRPEGKVSKEPLFWYVFSVYVYCRWLGC